jgi:ferredoxin
MRVTVDEQRCIGTGQCVMIAPDVFTHRDDGISEPIDERPGEGLHDLAREAADECPALAIHLGESS